MARRCLLCVPAGRVQKPPHARLDRGFRIQLNSAFLGFLYCIPEGEMNPTGARAGRLPSTMAECPIPTAPYLAYRAKCIVRNVSQPSPPPTPLTHTRIGTWLLIFPIALNRPRQVVLTKEVVVGQNLTIKYDVHNAGPLTAKAVTIDDTAGLAGLRLLEGSPVMVFEELQP